jgi:UDP-N-acetyl-D-mannosaminuronic acid dehydrogenase
MTKITEQAYRYIQIAFAEELRVICERAGLDFAELRKACNTKWNISIPDALDGIGGECLPKDIKFFNFLAKKSLFAETAMLADIEYRKFLEKKRKKNQEKIV